MAKKLTAEETAELDTLVSEAIRLEAQADVKKMRIKQILAGQMGERLKLEHVVGAGTAQMAIYESTEYETSVAKKRLDDNTFAMLFPPKGDAAAIATWAASSDANKRIVDAFKLVKQQAPRLTLTPAK